MSALPTVDSSAWAWRLDLALMAAALAAVTFLVLADEDPAEMLAIATLVAGALVLLTRRLRGATRSTTAVLATLGGLLGILLHATGAPASPLLPIVMLGGFLGARQAPRRVPWFVAAFVVTYGLLLLLVPIPAMAADEVVTRAMAHPALEGAKTIVAVGLATLVGGIGVPTSLVVAGRPAVTEPAESVAHVELRARLTRALDDEPLPADALLTAAHLGLNARQTELLAYLLLGCTNRQIADALCVSEATVKYRLTHLYRDLGVPRRQQAVELARRIGLEEILASAPAP